MNIGVAGVGRLGLSLALNLRNVGHDVYCYDISKWQIERIVEKTLETTEPQIEEMLKHLDVKASTSWAPMLDNCDIIFVVIQTPSSISGKYDHRYIDNFVDSALFGNKELKKPKHLVINSTVFPGYCEELQERIEHLGWTVSYNPEFIAQGSIVKDQQYPDTVLIGEANKEAGNLIENIYRSFVKSKPQYARMTPLEAEITKLSLNCFLTTKISFANMIGDICKKVGANPNTVLDAIGSDSRIGNKYLKYGFGFGGPCFPRDNKALGIFAKENDIDATVSYATDTYNDLHLLYQVNQYIVDTLGVHPDSALIKNRHRVVLQDGVAYKKGTDLLDESQQLKYALNLREKGFEVEIVDRKEILEKVGYQYPGQFILTERKS